MTKFAFLFPGQGAQYPGMMKDFAEAFSVAKETFQEADDLLGKRLSKIIFEGPAEELVLTSHSQVAIYVSSIAVFRTVKTQFPFINPVVTAGLSLGEYTALTAAGKLTFAECLPIVEARGLYMQEACERFPGSMQVVLGLTLDEVEKTLRDLNEVWVANVNCPGQIVIAGTIPGLERAMPQLKQAGAKRVLTLDVSGAFHSGLMKEAQLKLQPMIIEANLRESSIDIVMNVMGGLARSTDVMCDALIRQVTSPVRWEQGVHEMTKLGVEAFIEMGPGKTLAGMNKRIGVLVPTVSIEKISDLEGLENYAATQR